MHLRSLVALLTHVEAPAWLPAWIESYPYLTLLIITCLPYIELRGSIPIGVGLGIDPLTVFLVCTIANVIIILPIFLFLDFAFERVFRIGWVHRNVESKVGSVRRIAKKRVERYGYLGLAAFVGIPLPGTGAYSGCLAAYLLDMDRKKSSLAIAFGVLIAGVVVTLASVGVFSALANLGLGWAIGLLALVVAVIVIVYYVFKRHNG